MWGNILGFLFVIGLTHAQVHKLMSQLNPQIAKIVDVECLVDSNLDNEIIHQIEKKLIEPSEEIIEKLRCIPLCVFSKLGILDPKGNFNSHPKASLYIRINSKSTDMINKCTENSIDACDKANKFTRCVLDGNETPEKLSKVNDVNVTISTDTNTANNLVVETVTKSSRLKSQNTI